MWVLASCRDLSAVPPQKARQWLLQLDMTTLYIEARSLSRNGYAEVLNGKLPEELLDGDIVPHTQRGAGTHRTVAKALQHGASAQLAGLQTPDASGAPAQGCVDRGSTTALELVALLGAGQYRLRGRTRAGAGRKGHCGMSEVFGLRPEQVDALLRFLGLFEEEDSEWGEWVSQPGHLPYIQWSELARAFIQALYDNGWIIQFDWTQWAEEAERYENSPEALHSADIATLQKLLTCHVRTDRFVEGHLLSIMKSGHITAILRRVQQIRGEMG